MNPNKEQEQRPVSFTSGEIDYSIKHDHLKVGLADGDGIRFEEPLSRWRYFYDQSGTVVGLVVGEVSEDRDLRRGLRDILNRSFKASEH